MNHLPFEDALIDDNDFGSNKIDEGSNFDIFEIMANTNKLAKELVNQELLIFHKYQVLDAKDIKGLVEWWRNHEIMFPIVDFLTRQILGIVGSQNQN